MTLRPRRGHRRKNLVYLRIKDKAEWPPSEEEQIPWLIWHPVKLAKSREHLKATRELIPYKEFRLED
jgi:hypothetical protein